MVTKKWLKSKTLYLGLVAIAGGIVEFVFGLPPGASVSTIVGGILVIIFRFYTNTAIAGTPGAKLKE